MARDDGFYLAEEVRRLCIDRPAGEPWRGPQVLAALQRAAAYEGDQQGFYLKFLDGLRDALSDDDDQVLAWFTRQASGSEARVLADSPTTRDHLTHVTQVFLLGWLVLNRCPKFQTLPEDWQPYGWTRTSRFERLNRAWLFTSLLHDCAYSVEYAKLGRGHELRVRALFGAPYRPGTPGSIDAAEAARAGRALWARRAAITGRTLTEPIRAVLGEVERLPDHAFYAGQALLREARGRPDTEAREVLEVAAASLACHNFRHSLDPANGVDDAVRDWLSVEFWTEPLAALLTVTDEIQEWGRERRDVVHARGEEPDDLTPASAILRELEVDDASGLSILARVVFRLLPEDREHALRRATARDAKNAKATRQYRNAFRTCLSGNQTLQLRLRIDETVEDVPCRVGRRFNWPVPGGGWAARQGRPAHDPPTSLQEVRATFDGGAVELATSGMVTIRREDAGDDGLRVMLVVPGGAGKSTLLRALADTGRMTPGKRPIRALYVEELGEDLADLVEEAERLRGDDGGDLVLLIDHLDRVAGTPHETYWVAQLEHLLRQRTPWLHVIAACRPEEYERTVGRTLHGYRKASLEPRVGPLAEALDADGRVRARAVERHLRGTATALEALGDVALSMGRARALERPMPAIEVMFDGAPAMADSAGRVRFVHDVVQDYAAARRVAQSLADPDPPTRRRGLRALLHLPRDVFRLLVDLLAAGRSLDQDQRLQAARGLSVALAEDGTIRHWLSDYGRVAAAGLAIRDYVDRFAADERAAYGAQILFGLLRFERFQPSHLELRFERAEELTCARDAALAFARAARALDHPMDPPHRAIARVHAADHLLTVMTRLALYEQEEAAPLQRSVLTELGEPGDEGPETVGWLGRRVGSFDPASPLDGLEQLEREISRLADASPERTLYSLRLYQMAGHVGGSYLVLPRPTDEQAKQAIRWQDRARSRALRVVRGMENGVPSSAESFGSVAEGLGDAARHASANIYFWTLRWSLALQERRREASDILYRLLDVIESQEEAWRAARLALRPGERLPSAHWLARTDRAWGRVLLAAHRAGGLTEAEAARALEREHEKSVDEDRRLAEATERERAEHSARPYRFLEEHVGRLESLLALGGHNESG